MNRLFLAFVLGLNLVAFANAGVKPMIEQAKDIILLRSPVGIKFDYDVRPFIYERQQIFNTSFSRGEDILYQRYEYELIRSTSFEPLKITWSLRVFVYEGYTVYILLDEEVDGNLDHGAMIKRDDYTNMNGRNYVRFQNRYNHALLKLILNERERIRCGISTDLENVIFLRKRLREIHQKSCENQ